MLKHNRIAAALAATILLAATLTGCPPPPLFNASGTFQGAWSGVIQNKDINVLDCPITLTFAHFPDLPGNAGRFVAGTADLEWTCLLPPEVITILNIEAQTVTVPVLAAMGENGELEFEVEFNIENIPPALVAALNLQGVENFPLQNLNFVFDSLGADITNDGNMDEIAGTLLLTATYDDNGTQNSVGVDGTFSAQRL